MKAKTYHGKPCGDCGGTERYASNRKCVPCARAPAEFLVRRDGRAHSRHRTIEAAQQCAARIGGEVWRAVRVS